MPPSLAIFHSCTGFRCCVLYTLIVPDLVPLATCPAPRPGRYVKQI